MIDRKEIDRKEIDRYMKVMEAVSRRYNLHRKKWDLMTQLKELLRIRDLFEEDEGQVAKIGVGVAHCCSMTLYHDPFAPSFMLHIPTGPGYGGSQLSKGEEKAVRARRGLVLALIDSEVEEIQRKLKEVDNELLQGG